MVTAAAAASAARAGRWVDTDAPITAQVASALVAAAIRGVVRYVPFAAADGRPQTDRPAFVRPAEVDAILGAGLQLGLVTDSRVPPWLPRQRSAPADAAAAVARATSVGYPAGAHLWLDWEGVAGAVTDAVIYLDGWAQAVREAGYRPALYCGYSPVLSGDALYRLPGYDSYWRGLGGPEIPTRGFAIRQSATTVIENTVFDCDDIERDLLGELPMVMTASPADSGVGA